MAEASFASGDYQAAEHLYRSALTGLYKTDPYLLLGLAKAQFALRQPQQARETLDALMAANPNFRSSDGHLLHARALQEKGDIVKALQEYEAIAAGFPGEEARLRYALLLSSQAHPDRACEHWGGILKRPDTAPAYYRREQREWIDAAKRELQASSRG